MAVHVSIHDVSPAFRREFMLALDLAHAAGVKPALLVVPNYHGRAPLADDPAFVDELQALAREGHEIMLHGFFHRAPVAERGASVSQGARRLFFQRVVSAGEAEFAQLTREAAARLLDDGDRVLREVGLASDGFIAPAWSKPSWLVAMLGERGVRYTEDHLRVFDPSRARSRPSLVLNYASRSPARIFTTVAYARLARPARRVLRTRIAMHPGDMRVSLLRKETVKLLDWARGDFVRASDLVAD